MTYELVPEELEKDRPFTEETKFLIRLWYLGEYEGAEALKKMSVRQIAHLLHRREKHIRAALEGYIK